jgi:hypothetical protein
VERDGVFHGKHPDGWRKKLDFKSRARFRMIAILIGETKFTSSMTGESPELRLEILMTREH